ncbi:MAG: hypothetical protein KTR25_17390 [Myxococcales bacterium]|nr:hypothetical protein [Myxococcales bacterium]
MGTITNLSTPPATRWIAALSTIGSLGCGDSATLNESEPPAAIDSTEGINCNMAYEFDQNYSDANIILGPSLDRYRESGGVVTFPFVSQDGGRVAWSPLYITSSYRLGRSSSEGLGSISFDERCIQLPRLFDEVGELIGDGQRELRRTDIQINFPQDGLPQGAETALNAPEQLTHRILSATFLLKFGTYYFSGEGETFEEDPTERQSFDAELRCDTPFTAERGNAVISLDTSSQLAEGFCEEPVGPDQVCLVYRGLFSGDDCTFTARDVNLNLPDGTPVVAHIDGSMMSKPEENNTYRLRVAEIVIVP